LAAGYARPMSYSLDEFPDLLIRSHALAIELEVGFSLPPYELQPRYEACQIAASLALRHGAAVRSLIPEGFGPSAAVVLRSQYEATLRSVWLCYCADEASTRAFTTELLAEDAGFDKALPQAAAMLAALEGKAPPAVFASLANFRTQSWAALNSFVHAGLHPIKRHGEGLPLPLARDLLRSSNGLCVIASMQAGVAAGSQDLVSAVRRAQERFSDCCP